MRSLKRRRGAAALLATMALFAPIVAGQAAGADTRTRAQVAALLDQQNLRLASYQIEKKALVGGALRHPLASSKPATVIFLSVQAMLHRARALSPLRQRIDMRQ